MAHDPTCRPAPPVALTIAGSDCSAGAGIQADLKTFSAFGVYGLTAVSCVVSETSCVVRQVEAVSPPILGDQTALMLESFPVAAVKTGMLYSAGHIGAVMEALRDYDGPLVVDPVMMASTGDPLIEPEAIALYRDQLIPRATLATPNLDEAAVLLEEPRADRVGLEHAARRMVERFGCAVLLKGGHLGGESALDLLCDREGRVECFEAPFIRGFSTHGTGCTYSAAIAAVLARGADLATAVRVAKAFISQAIAGGFLWHGSSGPVDAMNHLAAGGAAAFEDFAERAG